MLHSSKFRTALQGSTANVASLRRCTVAAQPRRRGDNVEKLMEDTEALLSQVAKGKVPAAPSIEASDCGTVLYCDVSGCTIFPVPSEELVRQGPEGSMVATIDEDDVPEGFGDFELLEGDGWKLGVDHSASGADKYAAVIGSNSFTAAITLSEYDDFVETLRSLQQSINTLQSSGEWSNNDSEETTFEKSTERVWLQGKAPSATLKALHASWTAGAPAPPAAFSLRFIFTGQGSAREISGVWSPSAVMEVLQALEGASEAASAQAVQAAQVAN